MSPGSRRGLTFTFALVTLAWQLGACSFPNYNYIPGGAGGDPGAGGTSRAGAKGEGASDSGGEPPDSGTGTGGTSSTSGGEDGAAGEGEPPVVDIGPCGQRQFALHCFDHERNGDETDVDCGGARCPDCAAEEACEDNGDCSVGDCVDGACTRAFELAYRPLTPQLETQAFRFNAQLTSLSRKPRLLRQVTLRYYFSRNMVTEPIVASGSAFIQGGADVSTDTRWNIVRQIRGDGISSDAYVEIGFSGGRILTPGQVVEVETIVSAATSEPFNQSTHYSFDAEDTHHESKKLTAHYDGKRVWGRGPDADDPPSCLALGVNLDGAAVEVGGEPWLASPAANQARYQNNSNVLKPATDDGREDMIRSGFVFDSATFGQFDYAVENGDYTLVLYAWSVDMTDNGTMSAQGVELDNFQGGSFQGGTPWAPLGPYRITVDDGQLRLSVDGIVNVGGMELRRLDE